MSGRMLAMSTFVITRRLRLLRSSLAKSPTVESTRQSAGVSLTCENLVKTLPGNASVIEKAGDGYLLATGYN